jgi:hypothetical protein
MIGRRQQKEDPAVSGIIPQGYITVDEFRTKAKISLTKILNKYGIHQRTSQS